MLQVCDLLWSIVDCTDPVFSSLFVCVLIIIRCPFLGCHSLFRRDNRARHMKTKHKGWPRTPERRGSSDFAFLVRLFLSCIQTSIFSPPLSLQVFYLFIFSLSKSSAHDTNGSSEYDITNDCDQSVRCFILYCCLCCLFIVIPFSVKCLNIFFFFLSLLPHQANRT